MTPEIFKKVPGYEGLYEAGDQGTIRVVTRGKTGLRSTRRAHHWIEDGRRYVSLIQRGRGGNKCRRLAVSVHIVIAVTHLSGPEGPVNFSHVGKPNFPYRAQVKPGRPTDSIRAEDLEWVCRYKSSAAAGRPSIGKTPSKSGVTNRVANRVLKLLAGAGDPEAVYDAIDRVATA